ncbi:MAG TPA: hypothetical protein VK880_02320 [Anaerolineales bacterium]|nr:hypothetical protein [Anaerolineales bacterium]
MPRQPLFAGLVFDELGNPAESALVGDEPCYVVDDAGFRRHIPSEHVDRQVLTELADLMKGSEEFISEQTAKMLGQEDVFTKAAIQQQLKNLDKQFDQVLQAGIPEDMRAYLGMMGFKIIIDVHGEVLKIEQAGAITDEGDE